jgi:transposase-like protein
MSFNRLARRWRHRKAEGDRELNPIFQHEAKAAAHVEAVRWPHDVVCPYCGLTKVHRMGGKTQAGMFLCNDCRHKFTVRTGTIFHRSHIALHKWLIATHLIAASKRSRRSALELQRMLDLGSYRSAWFMCNRIRESMKPVKIGPVSGEVGERDETVAAFRRLPNASASISRVTSARRSIQRARDCRAPVMATGLKWVTVRVGRAVHVDHRACLPDPVHGFRNVPRRRIWSFDAAVRLLAGLGHSQSKSGHRKGKPRPRGWDDGDRGGVHMRSRFRI